MYPEITEDQQRRVMDVCAEYVAKLMRTIAA